MVVMNPDITLEELTKFDEFEREMLHKITDILDDARSKVWQAFEDASLDAAFFDIEIDLKVTVDEVTIRFYEKQEKVKKGDE